MGRSHGFGSTTTYYSPYSDSLSLRLQLFTLTLHVIVTRRFILQKARCHTFIVLQLLVSTRFQVLFHSPPGVLFTFPSRYCFTIGRQVVFSLRRWSSQIQTGFLVSRPTWGWSWRNHRFAYAAFTLYGWAFQPYLTTMILANSVIDAPQPLYPKV